MHLVGTFNENVDRGCSKPLSAFKGSRATVQRGFYVHDQLTVLTEKDKDEQNETLPRLLMLMRSCRSRSLPSTSSRS